MDSLKIPPRVSSTLHTAPPVASTAAAAASTMAAAAPTTGHGTVDSFESGGRPKQRESRASWSQPTPIINQYTLPGGETKCGGVVGAMLLQAAGHEGSPQALMDRYFSGGSHLTFRKLSEGLERGGLTTHPALGVEMADWLVRNHNKVIAQVKPEVLGLGSSGQAHFLLLEGMEGKGSFRALDPGSGKALSLSPDKLRSALVRDTKDIIPGPIELNVPLNSGLMAVSTQQQLPQLLSGLVDLLEPLRPGINEALSGNTPGIGSSRDKSNRPVLS
jgi:hypothetical protein